MAVVNKFNVNRKQVTLDVIYDVTANNSGATFASLQSLLSSPNLDKLIPTSVRHGGMSIRFVQSSDNKYVQYRLMADSWSINTNDWSFCGDDVLVECPEFIYVKTDAEDKILWAIKIDGGIYYGAGVPQQIIDYINEKIVDLSLDEYENIVDFLNNLEKGDKTLQTLLNEKVDKEEGKGLIDAEYASSQSTQDNLEFLDVTLDAEDKIIEGTQADGTKVIGGDLNVGGSANISGDVRVLGNMEVSGVSYKVIENPEYLVAWVDAEDKVIFGLETDGKTYVGDADFLNDIEDIKAFIQNITDKNIDWDVLSSITATENPEFIEVKTDSDGKIISYRDADGVKHEIIGIETSSLTLTKEGMTEFQKDLRDSGFRGGAGDWSDYISNDGENPLHINTPTLAMINLITNYDLTLLSKKGMYSYLPYWPAGKEGVTYDIPIVAEFYDRQGNYFKKKCFISGQGSSTMYKAKKNIAIDFFDSDWDEDAFSIKFGNWVPQDSFHLKAYDYDPFIGIGVWPYKLYNDILKSRGIETDRVWKKALLDPSLNSSTRASGNSIEETEIFNDNGARCFPDGFPVIVYQNDVFWGVFSWQLKKHRDNYHMDNSIPEHIHLDGTIGSNLWTTNGDGTSITWKIFEIRNPKNLVYSEKHQDKESGEYIWKYDADIAQANIAGNDDGSQVYDTWVAGSYAEGKIVEHNSHLYLNTLDENTSEPIYHAKNNSDSSPDFKNKTGCGWLNVTNTVKVKEYILNMSKIMGKINAKNEVYISDNTPENLAALKTEFETYFDVNNLIDYIIVCDAIRNDDGFNNNWQWTTYDGIRWWCNLYDVNISFGYVATDNIFRSPLSTHVPVSNTLMIRLIYTYYKEELENRWKELRDKNIISLERFITIAETWTNNIGNDMLTKENIKWKNAKTIDNEIRIKKWIDANINGLDSVYHYNKN